MTLTSPGVPKSAYYVALDGLRAVAVIMVFFQHYGAGRAFLFGWGWTGVDIFFVLSGFLITGILYDSQHKGHRYRDFYVRRTLRIFPLYYFIWAIVLLVARLAHWQWNWRWALWPVYLGNYARFFFLHVPGDPYRFDKLTFGAPVSSWFGYPFHLYIGHFWSLCVEEQFYLIWPLIVYQVRRRETLIKICLAAVIFSPILRGILSVTLSPQLLRMELFYRSLPTRLDALLIGGLVALSLRGPEEAMVRRLSRPLLLISAALFVALYLIATKALALPLDGSASNWIGVFGFTIIDVFAAALILECIHPGSALGAALSWRPLRALGIISYGFYVYHDLLHDVYSELAHRVSTEHPFAMTLLVAFTATLLIAALSYRFLERPLLKLKDRFAGQVHRAPTV
ncbi:acyltransferase family protein [Granulicella aggregans]|uniref:acyltransferase family protein n=1 Tax=Granulicella aggregans TaxID=474949 RepID=UPI0021E0DC18|nr:acyltransferase [Granulicella aggregans]